MNPSPKIKDESECVLSKLGRAKAGNVAYPDPTLGRSSDIDVVNSNTVTGNHAAAMQALHDASGERGVLHDDPVHVTSEVDDLLLGGALPFSYVGTDLGKDRFFANGIGKVAIKYCNRVCHCFLRSWAFSRGERRSAGFKL